MMFAGCAPSSAEDLPSPRGDLPRPDLDLPGPHPDSNRPQPDSGACGPARPGAPVVATAEGYKREVACRIHARNGSHLYEGAPPPVLRSIVVLSVRIDASGRPVRIGVLRSNGIRMLERRAIQSVRSAAPLPVPGSRILRKGSTDIVETWLFRDDGRFQVRSLAAVQAASGY